MTIHGYVCSLSSGKAACLILRKMSMRYTEFFSVVKNKNFISKILIFFLFLLKT